MAGEIVRTELHKSQKEVRLAELGCLLLKSLTQNTVHAERLDAMRLSFLFLMFTTNLPVSQDVMILLKH